MRTSVVASRPRASSVTRASWTITFLIVVILAVGGLLAPRGSFPYRVAVAVPSGAAAWTNVSASSPLAPPLSYWAGLTLDYPDRELVLFGGCSNTRCPEAAQTWTFAHGVWSNVTGASAQPPTRSYASLDYDSADGFVVLFGGVGASNIFGDTWTFAGGHWTDLTAALPTAPRARWGASMAYDPIDRGILLFGGMSASGAFLNDTWIFTSGAWHNVTRPASPPARFEASMAWDAATSEAVLVDGCGATVCPLGDGWRFQNGSWSPLPSGAAPPPRTLAVLSYDAANRALVLFAGIRNDTSLGDAWSYVSGSWAVSNASAVPTAREGAAIMESTEVWTSQGAAVVWPYLALWGGDWMPCPSCHLEGLADTWIYEPPLTATLAASAATPRVGAPIALGASASGGTEPYRYAWTYGDGATDASGANTTHVFAAAGSYTVAVVVVDDAGAHVQAASVVTVSAPTPALLVWAGIATAVVLVGLVGWWVLHRRRPPPT